VKRVLILLIIVLPFILASIYLIDRQNQSIPVFKDGVYIPYSPSVKEVTVSELLKNTNSERINAGLSPLKENAQLDVTASLKCTDLVKTNYWSHDRPDGTRSFTLLNDNKVEYTKAGENLGYGINTARDVVNRWMNSKTHRDNILDPVYTDVGFAVCKSTINWIHGTNLIVVQHFIQK